jgi:AcrR family transcriptional regulator
MAGKSTNNSSNSSVEEDVHSGDRTAQLIDTAIDCFRRYGVHRTRVEDVADAAEMSRPTFYKYFAGREDLIDAVVLKQLSDFIAEYGPGIWKARSFRDAVIGGSVQVLGACRADDVFMELLHRARRERLGDLGLASETFAYPLARDLWVPVLAKARERDEIRADLDDHDIIAWLASVHLLFLLSADATPAVIKSVLARFVIPAIVVS